MLGSGLGLGLQPGLRLELGLGIRGRCRLVLGLGLGSPQPWQTSRLPHALWLGDAAGSGLREYCSDTRLIGEHRASHYGPIKAPLGWERVNLPIRVRDKV